MMSTKIGRQQVIRQIKHDLSETCNTFSNEDKIRPFLSLKSEEKGNSTLKFETATEEG